MQCTFHPGTGGEFFCVIINVLSKKKRKTKLRQRQGTKHPSFCFLLHFFLLLRCCQSAACRVNWIRNKKQNHITYKKTYYVNITISIKLKRLSVDLKKTFFWSYSFLSLDFFEADFSTCMNCEYIKNTFNLIFILL